MRNCECAKKEENSFYAEILYNIFCGEISVNTCMIFEQYLSYIYFDIPEIFCQINRIFDDEIYIHKNMAKNVFIYGKNPVFFDKKIDFLPQKMPIKNMFDYALYLKEKCIVEIKIAKTKIKNKKTLNFLDEILRIYQIHKNIFLEILNT